MTGPLRRALDLTSADALAKLVVTLCKTYAATRHEPGWEFSVTEIDIRRAVDKGIRAAYLDLAESFEEKGAALHADADRLENGRVVRPGDVIKILSMHDHAMSHEVTARMIRGWVARAWPDETGHGG